MTSPRPRLFVLASSAPFGAGEPYLQDELPHLVPHFLEVTLVSTWEPRASPARWEVPGVRVVRCPAPLVRAQAWRVAMPGPVARVVRELATIAGRTWRVPTLAHARICIADYVRAEGLASSLERVIDFSRPGRVILCSHWHDFHALAVVLLKKRHPGVVGVARMHRWDVYDDLQPHGYLPFKPLLFEGLDRSYAISRYALDRAVRFLGAAPGAVKLSRLGVPFATGSVPEPSPDDRLHLVSASHVSSLKRVERILRAAVATRAPLTWIHAGDGPSFESLRAEVAAATRTHPHLDVRLLGHVAHATWLEELGRIPNPLFVNVSFIEGVPVSIMEAMSWGIPVLATAVGGTPEIVRHQHNGFLLEQDPDPEAIAHQILAYQRLPPKRRAELRAAAHDTWREHYNAPVNYTAFAHDLLSL